MRLPAATVTPDDRGMLLEHQGRAPVVDPEAYVAPTATLCGDVRVGPGAYLTGATVEDDVFLATGSRVFNGARIGTRAEVRINGVVHLRTVVPPDATVPIGWVAVGDPARILPPEAHDEIWAVQRELDFPGYVFGLDRPADGETIMPEISRRYGRMLSRHRDDRAL